MRFLSSKRTSALACALTAAALCAPGATAHAAVATSSPYCKDASGNTILLSGADRNTANLVVAPRLGQRLVGLRPDGRIPLGFNDNSVGRRILTFDESSTAHRIAGSTIHRVEARWAVAEPKRDAGYNWRPLDDRYCSAMRAGLTPLLTVQFSPAWATDCGGASGCYRPPAPKFDGELREFATDLAIRYPGAVVEAWNEPNLRNWWGETLSAKRYVAVMAAIYRGVKDGSPATPVIGGSLGNAPSTDTQSPPRWIGFGEYLTSMYEAGARNHMDGLGIHPYLYAPLGHEDSRFEDTLFTTRWVLAVQEKHGREYPGRRVWVTEVGARWADEQHTTRDLREVYERLNGSAEIDAVVYHSLASANPPTAHDSMAWLHPRDGDGDIYARDVYCSFAHEFGRPFDCSQPVPLGG